MLTKKLQALAAGVVLALAGVCTASVPEDKVAGKVAKPVVVEKNAKKLVSPAESAKPKITQEKKKPLGVRRPRGGVPDDSI